MGTIGRIFSYDDLEDKDIHNFLESIPPRHRSKLIRMAIRNYIRKTQDESISFEKVNVENENADKRMNI